MPRFEDAFREEIAKPVTPPQTAIDHMRRRLAENEAERAAAYNTPESIRYRELLAQMAAQLYAYSVPTEPQYIGLGVGMRRHPGHADRPSYERGFHNKVHFTDGWYLTDTWQSDTPNHLESEHLFLSSDGKFAYHPEPSLPAADRAALWARQVNPGGPVPEERQGREQYLHWNGVWYSFLEDGFWKDTVPSGKEDAGFYFIGDEGDCQAPHIMDT